VFAALAESLAGIDWDDPVQRDNEIGKAIGKMIVLVASTPDMTHAERTRVQTIINLAAQLKSFRDVDGMTAEIERLKAKQRAAIGGPAGPTLEPRRHDPGTQDGAEAEPLRGRPRRTGLVRA